MSIEPELLPIDPWAEKLLLKAAEDEAALMAEGLPDGPFGFHAQQAVEKLLKALLSQMGIAFEYTHDVVRIAAQLKQLGIDLPVTPMGLDDLNRYAVVYRYDTIPYYELPNRPAAKETVRLIREHVLGSIATLRQLP